MEAIEAIARIIEPLTVADNVAFRKARHQTAVRKTKAILSLKDENGQPLLGVIAEDQSLPDYFLNSPTWLELVKDDKVAGVMRSVHNKAQQDMLKAGFRRLDEQ